VRSTYREKPIGTKPSPWRITLSVLSILVALGITAALATQIFDQVVRGVFIPENYFSYFSIQTSIANIAVLTLSGIVGIQTVRDSATITALRGAMTVYAILTAVVYNVLLRDLVENPAIGEPALQWPIELTHVWVPVYMVIDWLVCHHRSTLSWWFLLTGLVYPALWFGGTVLRGSLTGWYPYAFLDPSGGEEELVRVGTYVGIIGGFTLLCLAVALIINRIHTKLFEGRANG